jgi:hypothetical protein
MPTGTLEFKCIRINLKRISTFEPDENQIDSLIEFDLKIGDECLRDLSAEVRQLIERLSEPTIRSGKSYRIRRAMEL